MSGQFDDLTAAAQQLGFTRGLMTAAHIARKAGQNDLSHRLDMLSFRADQLADLPFSERHAKAETLA